MTAPLDLDGFLHLAGAADRNDEWQYMASEAIRTLVARIEALTEPCIGCGGAGVTPEQHDYAVEMLGCPDCEGVGRVPVGSARIAAARELEVMP